MLNEDELFRGSDRWGLQPPGNFERGFRDYPARPRFHVSTRLGRKLRDIEKNGDYWMVSERAKTVLASVSATDFAFLPLEVVVDPGQEPMTLWLCDVIPVLDAVDEERSFVRYIRRSDGSRIDLIDGKSRLYFKERAVSSHRAFRLKTSYLTCIFDEAVKEAVKKAKLSGFSFHDALNE